MGEVAKLQLGDRQVSLPVVVGSEGELAVDVSKLRSDTGYITLDDGYANTGATQSAITFLDGEQGSLRYRGYPVQEIAEKCDFLDTSYLLIYGELPTKEQAEQFRASLHRHTLLHEDLRWFYNGFPRDAHPMAILSSVVSALSTFYQDSLSPRDPEQVEISILRLMAKLKIKDPIFEIAQQLEEVALSDEYFIERKLYPNVDFYSGVIYRAIGIPVQMFTVLFAMGRLPGWIAHWREMNFSKTRRIARPRQVYVGPTERHLP